MSEIKYHSPAQKIYYYHIVGMTTSDINDQLDIWSISHVLDKYGLPAKNGTNRGKLSELQKIDVPEQVSIEIIRRWIEEIGRNYNQYDGTEQGFESLKQYYLTHYDDESLIGVNDQIPNTDLSVDELEDEGVLDEKNIKPVHTLDFIDTVTVENFKKISNVSIKLSNITCLVGRNNSGKTSILQAIHFFNSLMKSKPVAENPYDSFLGINDILYVPSGNLESINRQALNINSNRINVLPSRLGIKYKSDEELHITASSPDADDNVPNGKIGVHLESTTPRILQMQFDSDHISTVFVPGISGISDREEMKIEPLINELAAKGDSNSVLRNILYQASQMGDLWLNLLDKLSKIYNKDYSITVEPIKTENGYFIDAHIDQINTTEPHENGSIPLSSAGTGFLQVLQILSYINVYQPKMLILDEPDSHLHPDIQKRLIETIAELSEERKFQVIIATHSTHILDSVIDQNGIVYQIGVTDEGSSEVVEDYNRLKILLDLGALDLYQKLGNNKYDFVVITEDGAKNNLAGMYRPSSDKDYLRILIENSISIPNYSYEILSYKNCNNFDVAASITEIIKMISAGTSVIIHRDRDFLDNQACQKFIESCESINAIPFLTRGSDIESYFLDRRHLESVFTEDEFNFSDYVKHIESRRNKNKDKLINKISSDRIKSIKVNLGITENIRPTDYRVRAEAERIFNLNPGHFHYGKDELRGLSDFVGQHKFSKVFAKSDYLVEDVFINLFN